VHVVGEVQRRAFGRQRLHLALGREDEDLVQFQVRLETLDELVRAGEVLQPLYPLPQPVELLVEVPVGAFLPQFVTIGR
jgi:hypothetical protein